MVWLCMCFTGVGTLTHIEGNINAQKYINFIDNNLWPLIIRHSITENYIFMDDNAPVHRARVVREYMETDNINHTEWPA